MISSSIFEAVQAEGPFYKQPINEIMKSEELGGWLFWAFDSSLDGIVIPQ